MTSDRHEPAYRIDGRSATPEAFYAVACDPGRSVVVEACAGAGKTWVLVSRIVRALLAGTPPQHILAITFTRKAAGEMRARLDDWLAEFAAAGEVERIEQLRLRGLDAASARRCATALGALHETLLDAGQAVEIRTFHGWFAQLMRAAPIDLLDSIGLDAGRALIEDTDELAPELYRRFHQAVLADASLYDDYFALVREHGHPKVRKWLDAAWDGRIEVALADRAGTLEPSVEPATRDGSDPAGGVRALRSMLAKLAAALSAQSGKRARDQGALLAAALDLGDADRATLAAAFKALFTDGEPRKLGAPGFDAACDALAALQSRVEQHDAHVAHQRMVRLARALLAQYAALKRDRGLADMDDLETVALALLRDSTLSGWVQQRLDAQLRQLLIDEFQDTSPLQWQALSAWLAGYAGAGGGGAAAPVVFIVGDPKQSVFRFRRAEPRVFAAAREFVRAAFDGALLECDHTRRNAPGVLHAVNGVFAAARGQQRFDGFREHTTQVQGDAQAPLARVLPWLPRPAKPSKSAAEMPRVWRDSLTVPRVEPDEPRRRYESQQVAAGIAELVAGGMPPGDIMVLARRHLALRPVEAELQARGLPYAAAEQVALMDIPEVRDLVALLDVLASPRHDLALAQALKSALFGIGDADLLRLAQAAAASPQRRWWPALLADRSAAFEQARTLLPQWAAAAHQLPPHDLLDRVIADADFVARVAARVPPARRASALAAIDALLALALELDGARYPSAYGFVRALKRRALKAFLGRPRDAVQLLTVHAAKGLEAPVVFLVDGDGDARNAEPMSLLVDWPVDAPAPRTCAFIASESRCPASLQALLADEVQARERETLNLLYVAMTRAKDKLVVSRTAPATGRDGPWWALLEPRLAPWPPVAAQVALAPAPIEVAVWPPWQPARAPAASLAAATTDVAAARLGSALHRLLEWASGPRAGSVPLPDLARAAAAQASLDATAARALERHAAAVLGSADTRRFYAPGAFAWAGNEVPLPGDDGELLRADRVVAFDSAGGARTWWVLDLKLHPAPHTHGPYREQLRGYRDALRRLQPADVVRCAFVTADGALIEPDLPA